MYAFELWHHYVIGMSLWLQCGHCEISRQEGQYWASMAPGWEPVWKLCSVYQCMDCNCVPINWYIQLVPVT